jgi:RNA polymerase sigma-70 factor (ECF subfamily)
LPQSPAVLLKVVEMNRRNNVSVAAAPQTQRTSTNPFLRRTSVNPAFHSAEHEDHSSVLTERARTVLAVVCRESVAEMDTTDEAESAKQGDRHQMEVAAETHAERLLHLFRTGDTEKEVESINPQQLSVDPYGLIFALYEEYCPRLFGYLSSLHLKREESEEVIQETFTLLTDALLSKKPIDNVQGWIVRVAHNLSVNVIRRKERDFRRIREISAFEYESVRDQGSSPEEALLQQEQTQQLEVALLRFTPRQRQCFYLRAEGFRYKDIAIALGISSQRAARVVEQVTVRLAAICG